MPRNARGCGVFRVGERCFSLGSILAAAAGPAHKRPYGKYGLYGAALAAEMAGDARAARRYYGRLMQVAGKGEPRAELQLARIYLEQ